MNNKIYAFVLMPFDTAFDDIYKLGIKETAKELNIKAERVDEQIYEELILEQIYKQINIADIIIADMTGQNPNVFYEVGYAHAKNKTCILLTKDTNDIPFDLKHHKHIIYKESISNLKKSLKSELKWVKEKIEKEKRTGIKIRVKSISGELKKNSFSATGIVTFKIDLLNEENFTSKEIHSINFYSTKGWRLTQDGKECPSTESDIIDFKKRHLISTPVSKLSSNGWAQLKFEATKTLEFFFGEKKPKSSYPINGFAILRIITESETIDSNIEIQTDCGDIPF